MMNFEYDSWNATEVESRASLLALPKCSCVAEGNRMQRGNSPLREIHRISLTLSDVHWTSFTFVDQHTGNYMERFSFTGKERDEETGYHYFGARYLDAGWMTGWLSVDPMSDKYPNLSPYNYCAWNPVKLVDPEGAECTDFYDKLTGKHLEHINDGLDLAIAIDANIFASLREDNMLNAYWGLRLGYGLGSNSDLLDTQHSTRWNGR